MLWWVLAFNRRRRGHNGEGRRVMGVLRRGVLCAAVRPRTWMCPTLLTQEVRHVWLRIAGTAELPRHLCGARSCLARTCGVEPTFLIEIFADACEKTPDCID